MTRPVVDVNRANQLQGEVTEVERCVLFIGKGKAGVGKTQAVNAQTDFDALLGSADTVLKRFLKAAQANAGQNWWAFVRVVAEGDGAESLTDAVLAAQPVCSVEGVVLCDAVSDKASINEAATLRATLISKYGRWVWFIPGRGRF